VKTVFLRRKHSIFAYPQIRPLPKWKSSIWMQMWSEKRIAINDVGSRQVARKWVVLRAFFPFHGGKKTCILTIV
jgi:hypothetical protein